MEGWKRVFMIIWSGQFASILSSQAVSFAVIIYLSLETGSAEVLALASICGMLPQALLSIVVGAYVDRWDRKRTMILSDSFIALCTLVLAILFWLDIAQMWHIYILMACRSTGAAFHTPAMQASVPLLAPESELTRIAGINQMIHSASNIAGPAIGALLISITSVGNILLLDVAGAAIACISLLFVRIPNPEAKQEKHLWREVREGFSAIGASPGMGLLFSLEALVLIFIMSLAVLFPLMTIEHYSGGAYQISTIEICWGVGSLLGGAILGLRKYSINKIVLINIMYIVIGAAFGLSGVLPSTRYLWFGALTAIAGISCSISTATFVSVVQMRIDTAVLGRVMSLYYGLSLLPSIIGLLATGFIAEKLGLTATFIIAGSLISLIGLMSFFSRSLMSIDKPSKS